MEWKSFICGTKLTDYFYQIIRFSIRQSKNGEQVGWKGKKSLQFLSCRKLSQIVLFSFVIIPEKWNQDKGKREKKSDRIMRQEVQSFTHMSVMPIFDASLNSLRLSLSEIDDREVITEIECFNLSAYLSLKVNISCAMLVIINESQVENSRRLEWKSSSMFNQYLELMIKEFFVFATHVESSRRSNTMCFNLSYKNKFTKKRKVSLFVFPFNLFNRITLWNS